MQICSEKLCHEIASTGEKEISGPLSQGELSWQCYVHVLERGNEDVAQRNDLKGNISECASKYD